MLFLKCHICGKKGGLMKQGGFEVKDNFRIGTDKASAKGSKGASIRGRGRIDFGDDGITFSV